MKLKLAVILGFVALCTATNPTIFPAIGKANIYDYIGKVHIGTKLPEQFGTEFACHAKLIITTINEKTVTMKLTEIEHYMQHDRVTSMEKNHPWIKISPEMEILAKPWVMEFDSFGAMTEIKCTNHEKDWSMNMKKSISATFMVNLTQVNKVKPTGSFDQVESTVQGPRYVNNNVHVTDDHVTLTKLVNTDSKENEFMTPEIVRSYALVPKSNGYELIMIHSRAIVVAHPKGVENDFAYSYDEHFMHLDQTKDGDMVTPPMDLMVGFQTFEIKKLNEKCKEFPLMKAPDMTGGRMLPINNMVAKINGMLESVIKYFDKNHITLMRPEMKEVNLINRALTEMEYADLPTLEELFAMFLEMKETQKEPTMVRKFYVFMELLPFVGTSPSVVLMRNIIRKKKATPQLITMMLNNFATEVKCPTGKILKELEDIPSYTKDDPVTYQAAILSIATLTRRVFEDQDKNSPIIAKIIAKFEADYKAETELAAKIIYVNALGNIGEPAMDRIMALLKNEEDDALRAQLLATAGPILIKDNSLLRSVVWNEMLNKNATLELRTTACMIYIQTADPTVSHFLNLFWAMRYENDEKFYNFMYNSIESLSETGGFMPSKGVGVTKIAKLILKMSRKPMVRIQSEGWHIVETMDPTESVGLRVEVMFVSSNRKINFAVRVLWKLNGEIVNFASVIGRYHYRELILRTMRSGRYTNVIKENWLSMPAVFNIITQAIGGVSTFNEMGALETILLPVSFEQHISTDLGTPMIMYERLAAMISLKAKIGEVKTRDITIHLKMAATRSLGMKVYNPFMDVWQGIHDVDTMQMNFPINFNVSNPVFYLMVVVNHQNLNGHDLGVQSYTEKQLFIENVNENVRKINTRVAAEDNIMDYAIPVQRQYVKPSTISVMDNIFVSVPGVQVKVFDCDRDISGGIAEEQMKTYISNPEFASSYFLHWQPYVLFAPGTGNCGAGIKYPFNKASKVLEIIYINRNKNRKKEVRLAIREEGTTKRVAAMILEFAQDSGPQNMTLTGHVSGIYENETYSADMLFKSVLGPVDYQMKVMVKRDPKPEEESTRLGFELDVVGMRSVEQDESQHILQKGCEVEVVDGVNMPMSKECLLEATALRKYVLTFKEFNSNPQETETTKTVLEFPMLKMNELEVTRNGSEHADGVPFAFEEYGLDVLMPPVNHFYGFLSVMDLEDKYTCLYNPNRFMDFSFKSVDFPGAKEWTVLYKNTNQGKVFEISTKVMENMVKPTAMRIKMDRDLFECIPNTESLICEINGKKVTSAEVSSTKIRKENFSYFITASPPMVFVQTLKNSLIIAFDGTTIRMEGNAFLLFSSVDSGLAVEGPCLGGMEL